MESAADPDTAGGGPPDAVAGASPEPALTDLPAAVRDQVLALAARGLGSLPPEEIPARLRPFARFAPRRRARLAAGVLTEMLPGDAVLRQRLAEILGADGGDSLLAAEVGDRARLARLWFTRPPGWAAVLAGSEDPDDPGTPDDAGSDESVPRIRQLADSLDAARADARHQRVAARRELAALRRELATVRAAADTAARETRTARAELVAVRAAAEAAQQDAAAAIRESEAAQRRSRRRVEDLTAELAAVRRDGRASRDVADSRLGLLLATLDGAVSGLVRELGLPAGPTVAPADTVAAREAPPQALPDARAESWDSPATLARFLALPKAHLLVDGYNVTKAALPSLPLARQRELLLRNLAGLAAQTGAEVTVVFDGADVTAVPVVGVSGVRVRFSPVGVTADEVLRSMARAEPRGRPVVVVSSDREVADGVRRAGATAVGAGVLVRRLLGG